MCGVSFFDTVHFPADLKKVLVSGEWGVLDAGRGDGRIWASHVAGAAIKEVGLARGSEEGGLGGSSQWSVASSQ